MERNEIKGAVKKALYRRFQGIRPGVSLDQNGYTATAEENLIDSVFMSDFEEDLRQGGGNELNGKFRAAHSSSALAVNVFGPFKRHLTNLTLLGKDGFDSFEFEKKCLTGLQGQPPNLDGVAQSRDGVVGVESKFTEYLQPHVAKFSDAYREKIRDDRRKGAWFEEMGRLTKEPDHYTYLDAAQLIKWEQTVQSVDLSTLLFDYSLNLKYYLLYGVRDERIGKDSNKQRTGDYSG